MSNHSGTYTANINTHNTARYTTSHHVQMPFTMFCFLLLLLIRLSIKQVVASAHAQLFPLVIFVGNTFPLVITVENRFPPLINVGKNNGSSFFKKNGAHLKCHLWVTVLFLPRFFLFFLYILSNERLIKVISSFLESWLLF